MYFPSHAGPGGSVGDCPASAGRYVTSWSVLSPNEFADGGDTISISFVVPAGASTTTFISRQYNVAFPDPDDTLNQQLVIDAPSATIYADPAGVCGGNSPCFGTLQTAVDAVATGGTVNLYGTFADGVDTGNKALMLQSSSMVTIGGTIAAEAAITVRGLNLTNANPFNGPGITAYANNLINADTFTAATVAFNWWGGFESGTQPAGVSVDDWGKRLGAAVEAYGIGSLGNASVAGGTGTAVIVSHGRGDNSAPFGQATVEDGNTQCSDYYDVFVPSGSGSWHVSLPVDAGSGCDSVYQERHIAVLNMANTGCMDGSQVGGCWDSALDTWSIIQLSDPRRLRINTMSTAALQGTPMVAGNQDNLTPTVIALHNVQAGHGGGWMLLTLTAIGLLLSGAAVWVNGRRKTGIR